MFGKLIRGSKTQISFIKDRIRGVVKILPANLVDDVIALYYYMLDPDVQWYRKTFVVGCLVYVINPLDAIPDPTPIFGFIDDAAIIIATKFWLGYELRPYYKN